MHIPRSGQSGICSRVLQWVRREVCAAQPGSREGLRKSAQPLTFTLGVSVLRIELRQMFRPNGLIDDVVVYGVPEDYRQFSERVKAAISLPDEVVLSTDSPICIEISKGNESEGLFTSLQNESNEYFSMKDWNARNILRVVGSEAVLRELSEFLTCLSGSGDGYSYISEFSISSEYSRYSPEWRLHVQNTS
ncbi:MAG: hypothetical protein M0P42_14440 [Gallionella sp.]|nr:hypothetical protein [Gallionella sp.]